MVRATDPDGMPEAESPDDTNADTVMVTIMVTDVDEAPDIDRSCCSGVRREWSH